MDISKDIQEVINQQLPSAVGEVLRKRLEQAEEDAKALTAYKNELAQKNKKINELSEQVVDLQQTIRDHAALDIREKTIADRERELKVTLLEGQLAAANDKTQFAKEVALGLVRNVEYRQSAMTSTNKHVPQPHGGTYMVVESATESSQNNAT